MALGTITKPLGPSSAADYDVGNKRVRVRVVQLTSGANYTQGGETITATAVGLNAIFECAALGLALPTGGATSRTVGFIQTADTRSVKMVVHTTASAEAAANSDQSTFSVMVRFVGR
jgi:hypothetical protein